MRGKAEFSSHRQKGTEVIASHDRYAKSPITSQDEGYSIVTLVCLNLANSYVIFTDTKMTDSKFKLLKCALECKSLKIMAKINNKIYFINLGHEEVYLRKNPKGNYFEMQNYFKKSLF